MLSSGQISLRQKPSSEHFPKSRPEPRSGIIVLRVLVAAITVLIAGFAHATEARARITWTGVAGTNSAGLLCGDGAVFFSTGSHLGWAAAEGFEASRNYTAVLAVSDNFFVLVAADGSVSRTTSPVGSALVERSVPTTSALRALIEIDAHLLAVGDNGTILRSSDLAAGSWVPVSSPTAANLRGIATNGISSTVAVGDDGVILRGGRSGTEWQVVNVVETADFRAVVSAPNGRYLAVGDGGAVWTSDPDGLTWVRSDLGTTVNFRAATQAGQATVVVGDDRTIRYAAANFFNWIEATVPEVNDNPNYGLHAVTWTGSDLVASGSGRITLWSAIGTQWQVGTVIPVISSTWGKIKQIFSEP